MNYADTADGSLKRSQTAYSRTRIKDLNAVIAAPYKLTTRTYSGGVTTAVYRNEISVPQTEVMADVVTPNFRELSRKGVIVTSPMQHVTRTWSATPFTQTVDVYDRPSAGFNYTVTSTGAVPSLDWGLAGFGNIAVPDSQSSWDEALQKAYAELNGRCMQLLVEIAEARKTLDLIRDGCERTIRLASAPSMVRRLTAKQVRSLRKTRKVPPEKVLRQWGRKTAGLAKGSSSTWLKWRYGVQPLVYGVQDAQKALIELINQKANQLQTGRGTSSWEFSNKVLTPGQNLNQWITGCTQGWVKSFLLTKTVRYRAGVVAKQGISANRTVGTDLLSVPSAVYELIPYSWMVDWFVNIGTWLDSLAIVPHQTILGSWVVMDEVTVYSYHVDVYPVSFAVGSGSSAKRASASGGSTHEVSTHVNKVRTVNIGRPILPSLRAEELSLTHVLDALAVVLGRGAKVIGARI
jgi:hypothetical protein